MADIDIFSSTLTNILEIINKERDSCILLGDFNLNLLNYNIHNQTNDFVDNIFSQGFIPLIHKPTRVTSVTATLIDHIYTNILNSESISGIILTDVADHFATFHVAPNKMQTQKIIIKEKRIYSEANIDKFKQQLDNLDFSHILNNNDTEEAYCNFIDPYKHAFNMCFPLTRQRQNKKYIRKEPWVTEGLLVSLRKKSKLFSRKLKNPSRVL